MGLPIFGKNLHLTISIVIIVPVAIIYGLKPGNILFDVFQFKIDTVDISSVFRAIMGLYIAMAAFWFIGILKPKFWMAATSANILFMGGLATGRIISLVLDGVPSPVFVIGLIVEILLAFWGLVNLKQSGPKPAKETTHAGDT